MGGATWGAGEGLPALTQEVLQADQPPPPALRPGPASRGVRQLSPSTLIPATLPGTGRQQWVGTKTRLAHRLQPLELSSKSRK